jgi:hypothetical protein
MLKVDNKKDLDNLLDVYIFNNKVKSKIVRNKKLSKYLIEIIRNRILLYNSKIEHKVYIAILDDIKSKIAKSYISNINDILFIIEMVLIEMNNIFLKDLLSKFESKVKNAK